ncbi:rCG26160 [Rattus norvegicus]|uniref:RCG26160 n=1 Tax=Rattus norvegicus TaxID=10116 RepID=A6HLR2_RAT|nr:rCG26160 [Rattus norvegicus]
MNPDDSTSGFRHAKVVMFINEQMSKNSKGPEFYLENLSLSWEVVEEKLKVLLESSEVPREVQEACAWGSLALGIRFAFKQAQLQGRRVQWLHDFASLHRSAAQGLTSDLKKLTEQQEMERKEAAYQLQLAHTKLAEVQRDRDLMRLKLLHASSGRRKKDCIWTGLRHKWKSPDYLPETMNLENVKLLWPMGHL